jgi:hypothetical protein
MKKTYQVFVKHKDGSHVAVEPNTYYVTFDDAQRACTRLLYDDPRLGELVVKEV